MKLGNEMNSIRWWLRFAVVLLCLNGWFSRPAQADFVITIKDAMIQAGTVGYVDITIHSTGTDLLAAVSYTLQITPEGGRLEFADSSTSSSATRQTDDEVNDPNYVFRGDSQGFSAALKDNTPFRLEGSDFASGDVTIDGGDRLLARVELKHFSLFPLTDTGSFSIALVKDPGVTYAEDFNGTRIGITDASFTSMGLITIVPAAVPEPSSLAALGLAGALLYSRRRRGSSRGTKGCEPR